MKIKNEKVWQEAKYNNANSLYGSYGMRYVERWADLMEAKMSEGAKLEDIADSTSYEADTEGITGFQYGCAVSLLALVWEHGEELRRWHNLEIQIGNEGEEANKEGVVLNPAIVGFRSCN